MIATEFDTQLEKALEWAGKKGFKEIKSVHEDHEKPFSYTNKEKDTVFTPHITASKDGRKTFIEIATKGEDTVEIISKWRLLSTMAEIKGGKLYLLAPRGHKSFTDGIVDKYPITATVLSI